MDYCLPNFLLGLVLLFLAVVPFVGMEYSLTKRISVIATDMDYMVGGLYGPVGIAKFNQDDIIMLKDGKIRMTMPLEELKIWLGIESEQILSGNTILGVEGTATSDATATENSLMEGEVAYVNGEKITGIIKEYDGSYSGSGIIV